MANVLLPLQAGTIPPPQCYPANTQELLLQFAAHLEAVLPGQAFYNVGDTKPSPELSIYPWLYTVDSRWYVFDGVWISHNNLSQFERRLFTGTLTDLITYDGGDNDPPSDRTGPMWVEDTVYTNHYPIGAGSIAAIGVSIDNFSYTLGETNIPKHNFYIANSVIQGGGDPFLNVDNSASWNGGGMGNENYVMLSAGTSGKSANIGPTNEYGRDGINQVPVPVYGPVVGTYIIKPSGRLYYSIS